ncbi:MAG: hypothetical protein IJH53_06095 [Oscillospiraceae bacterium]|nr:hypothetical protein [Oscillospiraceae bacterium]
MEDHFICFPQPDPILCTTFESLSPPELPSFLEMFKARLFTGPHPFSDYMRSKFKEKGLLQQNIFLAADLSEGYGYKLISGEKHTVDRDVILRICLAARFDLCETQEALILYGMAPLFIRLPRDIVLIKVFQCGIYDIEKVNDLLIRCNQKPITISSE